MERDRRNRSAVLAAVRARLREVRPDDMSPVLTQDALDDLAELFEIVAGGPPDLEVLHVAGWLYWYRYMALGPGRGDADLNAAVRYLTPVWRADPAALPEELASAFEDDPPDRLTPRRIPDEDPAGLYSRAAYILRSLGTTPDVVSLTQAIRLLLAAMKTTPENDPNRIAILNDLCFALHARYLIGADIGDLEEAVRIGRKAALDVAHGDLGYPQVQFNLGRALESRHASRIKRPGDIADAVTAYRLACRALTTEAPEYLGALFNLSRALIEYQGVTQEPGALDESITLFRQFISSVPEDSPIRPAVMQFLGYQIMMAAELDGSPPSALDESVRLLCEVAVAGPGDLLASSDLAGSHLGGLDMALRARYRDCGDLPAIDAAIGTVRERLAMVAATPAAACVQGNLGDLLRQRFEISLEQSDLEAAVASLRGALAAMGDEADAEVRARCLRDTGAALRARFDYLDDLDDLDEAIDMFRRSVALAKDDANRASRMSDLGKALRARSERTGELAVLEEAISVHRAAVELAPPTDPMYYRYQANLAIALRACYDGTGDVTKLDEAISTLTQTAELSDESISDTAFLTNLGALLSTRFENAGEISDLNQAIEYEQRAMELAPADWRLLDNLGVSLNRRFGILRDRADIDQAILYARQAIEQLPADRPERADLLSNLNIHLVARFDHYGDPADLDAAVDAGRRGRQLERDGHPRQAAHLSNFCGTLLSRFRHTGSIEDLNEAIDASRAAVTATRADHPARARRLRALGNALYSRYRHVGDFADLAEAERAYREEHEIALRLGQAESERPIGLPLVLMELGQRPGHEAATQESLTLLRDIMGTPDEGPSLPAALSFLAQLLGGSFHRSSDLSDLEQAIRFGRLALDAWPPDDPDRMIGLSGLGLLLREQYLQVDDQAALDEAAGLLENALAITPDDHPQRPAVLGTFGLVKMNKADRDDNLPEMENAIRILREAIKSGEKSSAANLVTALTNWSRRTADVAAVREAKELSRRILDNPETEDRDEACGDVLNCLALEYELTGDPAVLSEALGLAEEILADDIEGKPKSELSIIGILLAEKYRQYGDARALDQQIDIYRRLAGNLHRREIGYLGALTSLGNTLISSYKHTGDLDSLRQGIDALQRAAEGAPSDHPDRGLFLSNYGVGLLRLYERLDDPNELARAVEAARAAAAATPTDHPRRALRLSNLTSALLLQYRDDGTLEHVNEAVHAGREAVALTPAGQPGRAVRLSNLGSALTELFRGNGDLAALTEAAELLRQAVARTSTADPDRARCLTVLGDILRARYSATPDRADLDEAIDAYRDAVSVTTAPTQRRASAATQWGRAAAQIHAYEAADRAFTTAMELLARIAPRSMQRGDQENQIASLAGLASDAAACALRLGSPERALTMLEEGRGILLAQTLETRSDLTAVRERAPEMAGRLEWLWQQLTRPGDDSMLTESMRAGAMSGFTAAADIAFRRRELMEESEALIGQIRNLPGLANFLRPPVPAELLAEAEDGPVVLVNVSRLGCDALILTTGGIRVVPLPDLSPEIVYERVVTFLGALNQACDPDVPALDRSGAERQLRDVLAWLWDTTAAPVLSSLGLTGEPRAGEPWPRLWWSPTGLLGFLPLHAAGHYSGEDSGAARDPRTVIDRVISSYTPTIKALRHSRVNRSVGARQPRALAVAVPRAIGLPELPFAEDEAEIVARTFPAVTMLLGRQATRTSVLSALASAAWVHFACHGYSDLAQPSHSHLLLGGRDPGQLTVLDLARLELGDAQLAYLSACSTARTGFRLADEAIHITSAFQLAGYRHVIGTLWPIMDETALRIADHFYQALLPAGGTVPELTSTASALHETIRAFRSAYPATPSQWAAYIHVGG